MALCLAKEKISYLFYFIKIVGELLLLKEASCPFGYLDRSQLGLLHIAS